LAVQHIEFLARFFAAGLESAWAGTSITSALAIVGLIGAIGLTTLAVAVAARFVTALVASLQQSAAPRHAAAGADLGTLLSQSDPDADGRPRPRAPSRSLATA
jgi:hypothetical protein